MAFDFDDALNAGKSLLGGGDDDDNGDDDSEGGGLLDSLVGGAKGLFGGGDDDNGNDDGGGLADSLIGAGKNLLGFGDDDGAGAPAVGAAGNAGATPAAAAVVAGSAQLSQVSISDDIVMMSDANTVAATPVGASTPAGTDVAVPQPADAATTAFVADPIAQAGADNTAVDHAPPEVPMPEAEIATVPEPTFDERIEIADTMEDSLTDDLFEGLE